MFGLGICEERVLPECEVMGGVLSRAAVLKVWSTAPTGGSLRSSYFHNKRLFGFFTFIQSHMCSGVFQGLQDMDDVMAD